MERVVKHVRKNDVVQVMTGRDKGKTGKVLRVINKTGKVVVEKVNLVKRHKRASGKEPGGIVEQEAPIHASNVLVYGSGPGRGVRVSYKAVDGGKKIRYSRKHGIDLDK